MRFVIIEYPLQVHTEDAYRELLGGESFVFLDKAEYKFYVLLVLITLETPVQLKYFSLNSLGNGTTSLRLDLPEKNYK